MLRILKEHTLTSNLSGLQLSAITTLVMNVRLITLNIVIKFINVRQPQIKEVTTKSDSTSNCNIATLLADVYNTDKPIGNYLLNAVISKK